MIKRNNKKGFTIVELVIVIAVIAILAAVLIPTFSGIIRKANISADTQLVKNMNTALAADEAINGKPDSFSDVIAIVKDAGYVLSAFNPTTEGCYVAWDKETNQLLLVDGKDDFKVIYSANENYTAAGATWYFAVDSKEAEAELKAQYLDKGIAVNIEKAITNVKGLSDMLATGGTQEIYIDESLVLDKDNLLVFNKADANTTINLGNAQLNTSGIIEGVVPIQITSGTVTINGGVIGAAGSYVDDDGRVVNSPIQSEAGTTVVIDGTEFNIAAEGYAYLGGTATIKNAVINAVHMGTYVGGTSNTTFENTTIKAGNRVVWSCGHGSDVATRATATFKSGTYTGGNASWAAIVTCGGHVVIEGGNFNSNEGAKLFQLHYNDAVSVGASITITGGTFNGVDFKDITTEAEWLALCNLTKEKDAVKVTITEGKVVLEHAN